MNLKKLGVAVYLDVNGDEYVNASDLKLGLDKDVYERIALKLGIKSLDDRIPAAAIEKNF